MDNSNLYEKCFDLTYNKHDIPNAKKLAIQIIESGDNHVVPYICLSAIFSTEEDWLKCIKISKMGLSYNNHPMLLNHIGHAYCQLNNIIEGLSYFKKGAEMGDKPCTDNYKFWLSKI